MSQIGIMAVLWVLTLLKFSVVTSSSVCYFGSNINSMRPTQVQSCSDGEAHVAELFNATDTDGLAEHTCYVFRHLETKSLRPGNKMESVRVQYACDLEDVCIGRTQDKVLHNVTINNHVGKLYCCSSNKCNTNEKIPHPPSENRLCYTGPINQSGTLYAELTSCIRPGTKCAKTVVFDKEGAPLAEKYFCDETKYCQENLETSGADTFYSWGPNENNQTEEVFCCEKQKCFTPPWPLLKSPGGSEDALESPDVPEAESSGSAAWLVATIALIVLCTGGFVIAVYCRRKEVIKDPDVVQYKPLSNADMDMAEAVDL